MIHLRPKDYRVMPWKDGGGVTTELAIEPADATVAGDFAWRLSSAAVEASGPFSQFPGRLRALVLLEGAGLALVGGGRTMVLDAFDAPVHFPGDLALEATLLDGRCVDLGLIWDPRQVRAEVAAMRVGAEPRRIAAAPTTLLVAPRGGIRIEPAGPVLGAMDTVRMEAAEPGTAIRLRTVSHGNRAPLGVVRIWPSI